MVCAQCMKMCCLGGKNSVVKGLMYVTGYPVVQLVSGMWLMWDLSGTHMAMIT